MRPIITILLIIIIGFCVRIDLTTGSIPTTLPQTSPENDSVSNEEESVVPPPVAIPNQVIIVEPGQTVYGIVQELHEGQPFAIPIHEVLEDFETLNPEISANQLIANEQYKFPLYKDNVTN
ncbi:hypothetical protein CR203_01250 [Salipaludibacillus neizhouensis]|uniref:LysM domain-containing protein n=1 Tax=Salipaludibacillus neizhouensis TaxID=885475 RepID=A0A3A9KAT3_9BACI|nr:hypothetical protein [Salipaludibacillus neizhouensis]RKL68708.1 hypothetical protein CR203_01250 [Salipaludibacillus neizhouensis]